MGCEIHQYDGRSAFFTWIYRILLNFRRMDLRRKSENLLCFTDELPEREDPAPDPAEALVMSSSSAEVRAAVSELPEVLRTVIVLYYFEDFSVSEIGRMTETAVGTVKYRLFEARRRLARRLVGVVFRNSKPNQDLTNVQTDLA